MQNSLAETKKKVCWMHWNCRKQGQCKEEQKQLLSSVMKETSTFLSGRLWTLGVTNVRWIQSWLPRSQPATVTFPACSHLFQLEKIYSSVLKHYEHGLCSFQIQMTQQRVLPAVTGKGWWHFTGSIHLTQLNSWHYCLAALSQTQAFWNRARLQAFFGASCY